MKSKKLLLILLVVQLVLCLSLSVFAAEDAKLKFEVVFETVEPSGSIVKAGEEFSVLVNITENSGLAYFSGDFSFDSTQFTYVGFDGEGSVFGKSLAVYDAKASTGLLEIYADDYDNYTAVMNGRICYDEVGTLVKLTFKAVEDLNNEDLATFKFTSTQGSIGFCVDYSSETGAGTCKPASLLGVFKNGISAEGTVLGIGTEHEHTLVPATCLENEYCSVCKEEFADTALGHAWSEYKTDADKHWKECTNGCGAIDAEAAHTLSDKTCTESSVCAECGYVAAEAAGHDFSVWVQDETRQNHWKICSVCGEADETTRGAHEGGVADCTNDGVCTVCGLVYLDKLGHQYDDNAGSNAEGHWGICGRENCPDKDGEVKPHNPGEVQIENLIPSTCVPPKGTYEEVIYCKDCGWEIERVTKRDPLKDHTPGASVEENVVASTCTVQGSYDKVVYCSVCNLELSRETVELDLAPHTAGAPVEENKVASTCTVRGSYDKVVYCSVCNTEMSREKIDLDLAPHTAGDAKTENVVAATCYGKGSHDEVVYCSVCNAEMSRTSVIDEMINHTPGEAVTENVVDPTCTVDGSHEEVVYCTVPECKAEISRETKSDAAIGHDMKAATCTEPSTCARGCGHTEGDALGHDLTEATCTERPVCQREGCDHEEGEALGHDYKAATCTEAQVCQRAGCGHVNGDPLGHDMAPATCTEVSTCKREGCGHTEGKKLDHEFGEWQTSKAPTTKEEGEETRKCNNCPETETQSVAKLPTDYTWLIVAVILVLAAAGIVVVVVLKKKRK